MYVLLEDGLLIKIKVCIFHALNSWVTLISSYFLAVILSKSRLVLHAIARASADNEF